MDKIYSHACDFIRDRVASTEPANDGKQTQMRGHPVFIDHTQQPPAFVCVLKNGTNFLKVEN